MTQVPSEAVLAIDIGGTKTAVGLVRRGGDLLCRGAFPTDPERGPENALREIERAFRACLSAAGEASGVEVRAVGLGAPGPIDTHAGTILSAPNLRPFWGFPLVDALRRITGVDVFLENDANAAALGEARFGAGRGVRNLVYLTLSTGVGSGAIVDGRLLSGEEGNAPELGHTTIDFNGRTCRCGLRGCLEAYASGTALVDRARALLSAGAASSLSGTTAFTAADVVTALERGDPVATRVWEEAMEALAAGVGNAINTFNPKRVVVGGGLTGVGERLFVELRSRVAQRAMPTIARNVEIVPAQLGQDVGILGAAAVAWDRLGGAHA